MNWAGQNNLINAICKQLEEENVTSPTYAIIQEYHAGNIIIYPWIFTGLKNIEEAIDAGIEGVFRVKI